MRVDKVDNVGIVIDDTLIGVKLIGAKLIGAKLIGAKLGTRVVLVGSMVVLIGDAVLSYVIDVGGGVVFATTEAKGVLFGIIAADVIGGNVIEIGAVVVFVFKGATVVLGATVVILGIKVLKEIGAVVVRTGIVVVSMTGIVVVSGMVVVTGYMVDTGVISIEHKLSLYFRPYSPFIRYTPTSSPVSIHMRVHSGSVYILTSHM